MGMTSTFTPSFDTLGLSPAILNAVRGNRKNSRCEEHVLSRML
jgi:hypothetical protein